MQVYLNFNDFGAWKCIVVYLKKNNKLHRLFLRDSRVRVHARETPISTNYESYFSLSLSLPLFLKQINKLWRISLSIHKTKAKISIQKSFFSLT